MAVLKNKISLKNVSKTFWLKDRTVEVLKDITLDVRGK